MRRPPRSPLFPPPPLFRSKARPPLNDTAAGGGERPATDRYPIEEVDARTVQRRDGAEAVVEGLASPIHLERAAAPRQQGARIYVGAVAEYQYSFAGAVPTVHVAVDRK